MSKRQIQAERECVLVTVRAAEMLLVNKLPRDTVSRAYYAVLHGAKVDCFARHAHDWLRARVSEGNGVASLTMTTNGQDNT